MYYNDGVEPAASTLVNFLTFIGPGALIIFLTLLISFLILFFTEKRRRKLILKQSSEIDRIKLLNDISEFEKQQLIDALNCLPEVIEEYPLPDRALLLTAKLTKFYALFKVIMVILVGIFFAIFMNIPKVKINESMPFALIIISLITVLVVVLAIFEFIMAKKLTYGNLKARKFLIFTWMLNPFIITVSYSKEVEYCCMPVVFAIAIYSLWTLFYREGAKRAISFNSSKEFTAKTKNILAAILIALSVLNYTTIRNKNLKGSDFQSTSGGGISWNQSLHPEINQINFIAISKDKRIEKLARSLAEKFSKQHKIKVVVIANADDNRIQNVTNQATVFLNKLNIKTYKKLYYKEKKKERSFFSIGIPEKIINNPFVSTLAVKVDAINITTGFRSLNFQKMGDNFEKNYSLAYMGSEAKAIEKLATEIYNGCLVTMIHKKEEQINIPSYVVNQEKYVDLVKKFQFLEGVEILHNSYDFYSGQTTFLRIPVAAKDLVKKVNKLKKSLEENGFDDICNRDISNNKTKEVFKLIAPQVFYLRDKKQYTAENVQNFSNYIVLVYQRMVKGYDLKKKNIPDDYRQKFKRFYLENPLSFLKLRYDNRQFFDLNFELEMYQKFLNGKNLSQDLLYKIYTHLQKIKCDKKLKNPLIVNCENQIFNKVKALENKKLSPKEYIKNLKQLDGFIKGRFTAKDFKTKLKKEFDKLVPVIEINDLKFSYIKKPEPWSPELKAALKRDTGIEFKDKKHKDDLYKSKTFTYPYDSKKSFVMIITKNGVEVTTLTAYEYFENDQKKLNLGSFNDGDMSYKFKNKLKRDLGSSAIFRKMKRSDNSVYYENFSRSSDGFSKFSYPEVKAGEIKIFYSIGHVKDSNKKELKVTICYGVKHTEKSQKRSNKEQANKEGVKK
ncbi:hypothetical protein AAEX28_01425 [Lentisphaerota bacterium WC36G]|nr:hypothetical protein LJT99_04310 [Lentisphaerae bacterium WC36]